MAKKNEENVQAVENEELKVKFQDKLKELLVLGQKKKNILEYQQISDFFKELNFDAERFDMVLDYLVHNGIDVLRMIDNDDDDDMIVGMIVEQKPVFPGGQKALMEFLKSNLVYPKAARDSSIQGRVMVKFTVEKDGSITDVEVVRGVHPALDEEAVRVVSMMPKWKPGTQMGDTVRTKFTLPVLFKINQEESKK